MPNGTERISRDDIRAVVAAQLGSAETDIDDHDDLIQLGLNSVRMMALAGGWRRRGASVTFADLAATPTVDAWHELLSAGDIDEGPQPATAHPIPAGDDDDPFPLAPMQHAYWIGRSDEQELGGVAAHLYVEFDGGEIDPVRLERAVSGLLAAHPMLRTRFLADGTQQTMPAPG
jgi:mycobactin phenyloxazoline synthetase